MNRSDPLRCISSLFSRVLSLLIVLGTLPITVGPSSAHAQVVSPAWTPPVAVSNESAGMPALMSNAVVSDAYGNLHMFWVQNDGVEERSLLYYSRFDGREWSKAVDLHVTQPSSYVWRVAATILANSEIYLFWTEGVLGTSAPVSFMHAFIGGSSSVRDWSRPESVDVPADQIDIAIDAKGVFHLVYSIYYDPEPDVYYKRSADRGQTWTTARKMGSNLPNDVAPRLPKLVVDQEDGVHLTWFYSDRKGTYPFGSVRYARSLDGGRTWSPPFTIAENERERRDAPRMEYADPVMAVSGNTVHVIWAGGSPDQPSSLLRFHRQSPDRGLTWSAPTRVFGDLNGQAEDGITVDARGRVHYFAQIRFPQGIYHASWDGVRWIGPELIYLIRQTAPDELGDRIHAHSTHPAIRQDNQLVLTFHQSPGESVNRNVFAMTRSLDDIPAASILPPPAPTVRPPATAVLTKPRQAPSVSRLPPFEPTALPRAESLETDPSAFERVARRGPGLLTGALTAAMVVLGMILFRIARIIAS